MGGTFGLPSSGKKENVADLMVFFLFLIDNVTSIPDKLSQAAAHGKSADKVAAM